MLYTCNDIVARYGNGRKSRMLCNFPVCFKIFISGLTRANNIDLKDRIKIERIKEKNDFSSLLNLTVSRLLHRVKFFFFFIYYL